ncbi:MAG: hypothetical protein LAT68_12370 [Cyclobacteriaceae bacterium]|nr:hypothetical protein [Cyclobacteriaceae bacterium]MCH8517112.1 hypothetical protein [Cyclobacteriaceae bacterium]
MKKTLLVALLASMVLFACGGDKKPSEEDFQKSLEEELYDEVEEGIQQLSGEELNALIQIIPSPIEISFLLRELGTTYDKSILNDPDNVSNYNTNFKKALNLGVYGTDLGYTNIFEQQQEALYYLNSIKDCADGLNIGQFFDFATIRRLATNSSNLDSLLLITTRNFNDINDYLQNRKRDNLSALLLFGGWLEALHILNQVLVKNPDSEELKERIGEQKIISNQIVLILGHYGKNNPNISDLHKEFEELDNQFRKVNIVKTQGEPTFEEVNGVLRIIDNSSTTVEVSKETLDNINRLTKKIRANIIS